MKQSPIIGVTPLWDAERKSVWMLPDYLEGIKAAGGLPIVWAVQWHPEYMFRTDPASLAIFSHFIKHCK